MMSSATLRVDRLLALLESDPQNTSLIADAALAAFDAGRLDETEAMVARYAALAPPPPRLRNLLGLTALRQGRYDVAATRFADLLAEAPGDPTLRGNLAWSYAGLQDWSAAASAVDEAVAEAVPGSATLKVQALHQLGDVEDALAWGGGFLERRGGEASLLAALSAAALDADEPALAHSYAERAGDAPEALTTLGLLRLETADIGDAVELFDRALAAGPQNGRALLGKGLAALAAQQNEAAVEHLDAAAAVFGDHLGAWSAAGWACLMAGDLVRARQRFDTVLALDDTFAEAHGGLAVVDVMEGRFDDARRGARTALRLDRDSFAGLLARSLLLEVDGDPAAAQGVREVAMATPVGPSGQTIAAMMTRLAGRRR